MGGSRSGTSVEGISCSSEGCVHAELAFSYSPDRLDDACREASGWHTCMPPVSLSEASSILKGLCRLHVYASHRAEEKPQLQGGLGDWRRNHPSYTSPTTQSLSNLVEENKKFRKTRNTSITYTEEEETDREIYKRCLTPKKNQPRIKPEAFKL